MNQRIEIPLVEALKVLNKSHKGKEIRVCDRCGVPMIFTFCWAYKERYCLNCGNAGGMFGTGEDVELTDYLKYEYKVINDVWKAIYKNLIPRSDYKMNKCKKCDAGESHQRHLSKSEKFRDDVATKILNKLSENFTSPREVPEN